MLTPFAVLIGAMLPVLALAGIVRWRMAGLSNQQAAATVHRRRKRQAARRNSLAWISATLGRPASSAAHPQAVPSSGRCPHCRHQNEPTAFFCRRCGQRLRSVH